VPGVENALADSIFRHHMQVFRELAPLANPQLPALPTTEQVLLLFIADLSQRVCHGTARSYLVAIRHLHLHLPDPLAQAQRVGLALKGLRRKKPRGADARLPITPFILQRIGNSLVSSMNNSWYGQPAQSGFLHSCAVGK
jgi:hypothetical protein